MRNRESNYEERKRIGELIAKIRKSKGITQLELSELSGLARSHITHIERGDYNVRLDTLAIVAEALGCEVGFINRK